MVQRGLAAEGNSGVLVESLSLSVILQLMVIIFLGSPFGSQETAVVGMFGVPAGCRGSSGLLGVFGVSVQC